MLDGQALESLSTAGSGGDVVHLKSARECLGDNVVMVGNFDQVNLLKQGSQEDIRKRVRQIFQETMGDRRFIFSTSDSIVPGTPGDNVRALAEAALECAAAV
jgi:uroporphyrinogen-III decarboxylase